MLYLTNLLLLLLIINNADLEEWLERQCRPKIKLGRQKFRWPTACRGRHFVPTCFIVDSEDCILETNIVCIPLQTQENTKTQNRQLMHITTKD